MRTLIYLLVFNMLSFGSYSQDDSYSFPITRKSDAWGKMENYQQRWDACQVPQSLLSKMSTDGLIDTYLNYPLLTDLLVFRTTQAGVENLKNHFNATPELIARSDAQSKLVNKYKKLYLQEIDPSWSVADIGFHVIKIVSIESLLAQPSVLNSINAEARKDLLKIVYKAYQNKQTSSDYHGTIGLSSTAWLMTRIMKTDGLELAIEKSDDSPLVKLFVSQGFLIPFETVEVIAKDAEQFIK